MKSQHTGTIALVIAGLLLLVLAGKSYMDYVESKYSKKESELEAKFKAQQDLLASMTPPAVAGSATDAGISGPALTSPQNAIPREELASIEPVAPESLPPQGPATVGGETSASHPASNETLAVLQENEKTLAAIRQEQELLRQGYARLKGDAPPSPSRPEPLDPSGLTVDQLASIKLDPIPEAIRNVPSSAPGEVSLDDIQLDPIPEAIKHIEPIPEPTRPLRAVPTTGSVASVAADSPPIAGPGPEDSTTAIPASPGTIDVGKISSEGVRQNKGESPTTPPTVPDMKAMADLANMIAAAPSIGKVTQYLQKLNVIAVNCGSESNLKEDQKLSIRRGKDIVGYLKITEVHPDFAFGELTSDNRSGEGVQPKVGDDIITFNIGALYEQVGN